MTKKTKSAGGVVLNSRGQVLVTNQNGDSWSLPKGHVDQGEDTQTAAEREIAEETGITRLEFVKPLGTYSRAKIGKGGVGEDTRDQKEITMFLFSTEQEDLNPTDPTHPEARWVRPSEVSDLLTHPKDREFFESILPQITPKRPKSGLRRSIKALGLLIVILMLVAITKFVLSSDDQTKPLITVKNETKDRTVLVAVGDIACDPASPYFTTSDIYPKHCQMKKTADTTKRLKPDFVLILGDNQYENGQYSAYQASFDKSWGGLKSLIKPVPGNHEYNTPGAEGYYQYFGESAHPRSNGYYSFDLADWHIIALNSNCIDVGGCQKGSTQYAWLEQDLKANQTKCTLAYWHHPRFSSGSHEDNPITQDFWQILYDNKADVILNGHEHIYERFEPQDPNAVSRYDGLVQFTVGTGGKNLTPMKKIRPNSAVRQNNNFGVLALTLLSTGYNYKFVSTSNASTDIGTQSCQ